MYCRDGSTKSTTEIKNPTNPAHPNHKGWKQERGISYNRLPPTPIAAPNPTKSNCRLRVQRNRQPNPTNPSYREGTVRGCPLEKPDSPQTLHPSLLIANPYHGYEGGSHAPTPANNNRTKIAHTVPIPANKLPVAQRALPHSQPCPLTVERDVRSKKPGAPGIRTPGS